MKIFILFFLFISCTQSEVGQKTFRFMRSDNWDGARGGDSQDVGVIAIENKSSPFAPLEVSVTVGDQIDWEGFLFPLPTISDNYRIKYNKQYEPVMVTPQITGGRAHNFRSIIDHNKQRVVGAYVKNEPEILGKKLSFTPTGQNQGLLYKESSEGELEWLFQVKEGSSSSSLDQFDIDEENNIYMRGGYSPGSKLFFQESELFELDSNFNHFVLKVKDNGEIVWIRYLQAAQFRSIDVFEGQILLTGYFSGTAKVGSSVELESVGSNDALVVSYDTNGNYLWSKSFGGASLDRLSCATIDRDGIFITGYFTDNPKIDEETIISGTRTGAMIHLDSSGGVRWVRSLGKNAEFTPLQSNCVSSDDSSIYWGVYSQGEVQVQGAALMNLSGKRVLLLKMDKNAGKLLDFETITGATAASVFETFVDQVGRLTLGIYWSGDELIYEGKPVAQNGGGRDAFVAFFSVN